MNYYKDYNFESEPWWPKFETLRSKYGITVVKGGTERQARKTTGATKKATTQLTNNLATTQPTMNSSNENLVETNSTGFK